MLGVMFAMLTRVLLLPGRESHKSAPYGLDH